MSFGLGGSGSLLGLLSLGGEGLCMVEKSWFVFGDLAGSVKV